MLLMLAAAAVDDDIDDSDTVYNTISAAVLHACS